MRTICEEKHLKEDNKNMRGRILLVTEGFPFDNCERGFLETEFGELVEHFHMYVLSNKSRSYGAACIAYPHILEMIGGILRTDYYVLPSSVHEVVIVPCCENISAAELDEMIREINITQVDDEEVLSDHAYLYELKAGYLRRGTEFKTGGLMG